MSSQSVVFIGAGNLATHLAKGFYQAGVDIMQIINRHFDKAKNLADQVDAQPADDLNSLKKDADVYVVAVQDDALQNIVKDLSLPLGTLVHTSGTVPLSQLSNAAPETGVFYPLQTFRADQELDLTQAPICLEASSSETYQQLQALASTISNQIHPVDSEQRKTIHIAAVFLNNFTNHMLACAEELLSKHNMDFDLLRPLLEETWQKVRHHKPSDVQTGPAMRNDRQVITEHLDRLKNEPELQAVYRVLTESIQRKYS
jgi:predicted short-subunit dehydrogenase-like oxidoreductase (DUF2520 family)